MTDPCPPGPWVGMTIDEILSHYGIVIINAPDVATDSFETASASSARGRLRAELLAREDNIADIMREAGMQYGLFPQIVAEVMAQVGLGTPISAEQRELVHQQWHTLMDELRERHERGEQP